MISKSNYEETCSFCGRTRVITVTNDNHIDMDGRNWIPSTTHSDDKGCNCELGKIEFSKAKVKPMCLNCRYHEDGYCVNKKELSEVSEMFNCGNRLSIKTPTKKCKYHEINSKIFLKLLS